MVPSFGLAAGAAELVVELFHTTSAVYETLLPSISRVRVGSYVLHDYLILNTVDHLSLFGGNGGVGQKLLTGGYVDETNRVRLGMDICFHGSS